MRKPKHIPSPWVASRREARDLETRKLIDLFVVRSQEYIVTSVRDKDSYSEANASLIAAAPDLLEACKKALKLEKLQLEDLLKEGWPKDSMPIEASKENIRCYKAAIAKAEKRLL